MDVVVAHGHVLHRLVRIAVRDHEHGAAVTHRPFDQAALRREIENVVLVDPRRCRQNRNLVHLLGLRDVLDQLDQIVAVDDLARGRRKIVTDGERIHVDLHRPPTPIGEVVEREPRAAQQARRYRTRASARPD